MPATCLQEFFSLLCGDFSQKLTGESKTHLHFKAMLATESTIPKFTHFSRWDHHWNMEAWFLLYWYLIFRLMWCCWKTWCNWETECDSVAQTCAKLRAVYLLFRVDFRGTCTNCNKIINPIFISFHWSFCIFSFDDRLGGPRHFEKSRTWGPTT